MNKPLPKLKNFNDTRDSLRQAMQPLRSTRLGGSDVLPNNLNYGTFPTKYGATTGQLNFGGELQLDFLKLEIRYEKDGKEIFEVPLNGKDQVSLFNEVFEKFGEAGISLEPERDKITEKSEFKLDSSVAKEYAETQHRVYTAMDKFRSGLTGTNTPIILWPHGFDLSFLSFIKGNKEGKDPHINFGFSPGFGEQRPYLYFYVWPVKEELFEVKLPLEGKWNKDWGTPGVSFGYDGLREVEDPEETIYKTLSSILNMVNGN
ncbi:MAG TPA: hypothetical protein ENI23_11630 [bacterium]|nr:hypothetical protein [bacterium]